MFFPLSAGGKKKPLKQPKKDKGDMDEVNRTIINVLA